jgi:SAM-dependent methyltransferase
MKRNFDFKEFDKEGHETLDAIAEADKLNAWMYNTIKPYCNGRILEVGSGIGNISEFFLTDGFDITLSDIRDSYIALLKENFLSHPHLLGVENIDIVHPDFDNKYKQLIGTYDTTFALNVVEHIENDRLAISNTRKLLKPGGKMIILVPAYQALYNRFDEELYHFKRYSERDLTSLFRASDLNVIKSFYFNFMGIPGWYISGKLQKHKTIPKGQMKLYNYFVPVFKLIDRLVMNRIGLSVVAVGKKTN